MRKTFATAGVMGWPVAHSRSPLIHQHWLQEHQMSGAYGLFAVQPQRLEQALRGLSALGMAGCNITLPHKVAAMRYVDWVDPLAQRMGAINTVVVQTDGALHGFNNDGFGFIQSLLEAQPTWRADAGPAVVLGAGGAARAIVVSLLDAGATEVRLLNRTRSKAQALADELDDTLAKAFHGAPSDRPNQASGKRVVCLDWAEREDALAGASLLVNTTNQGMHGEPALDMPLTQLPVHTLVFDAIYTPLETPLLQAARLRGNPTVNGLGMLLHQARPAFAAWFGVMPQVTPQLWQKVLATLT